MIQYKSKQSAQPDYFVHSSTNTSELSSLWTKESCLQIFDNESDVDISQIEGNTLNKFWLESNSPFLVMSGMDMKKKQIDEYLSTLLFPSQMKEYESVADKVGSGDLFILYKRPKTAKHGQHLVGGLIKHNRHKRNGVFVHVSGQKAFILSKLAGDIKGINSYDFATKEDLLYFVLLQYRQYGIPHTIKSILSGGIATSSPLSNMLKDYLQNIEFESIPKKYLDGQLDESHLYFDMYLGYLCAS